nr:glycoside hydrolase family protein [uncultured Pedobacter sp.]
MQRKTFIKQLSVAGLAFALPKFSFSTEIREGKKSWLYKHLKPVHRILEEEGYYVWCCSPILADDGKVHVFYSRWDAKKGMGGWINGSEICQAVADGPEATFKHLRVLLKPRGAEYWDGTTCHNPLIKKVDGKYALFYMGNHNGKTNTKRIGLSIAEDLYGDFKHAEKPLLLPGETGAWDDHCTTNPAFVKHPNGKYYLFYKSWNTEEYEYPKFPIKGNRKYGLAIADALEGPYIKSSDNPVIDFSVLGNNEQLEDAYVWWQHQKFNMVSRDMGYYGDRKGIYMHSKDGLQWSKPEFAFDEVEHYISQPPKPKHLSKYGRFERPQLLLDHEEKPIYLFLTTQGGKFETSSPFVMRIVT